MLSEVLSSENNLGSFIHSINCSALKSFEVKAANIVQDVTHASNVIQETSAATEEILASVDEEKRRNNRCLML